ncbi:MAG TPA: HAMP domain-containing sensor histidine kinase, partial [Tepidisphaeraceae bacterium]|nr:HAMP domain-containing sensor histidine kinase [Tepidisphaeraceae bacterium]
AVLREVTDHVKRPLETDELVALNAALDVMSRRSVQSFVRYQAQELQAATEAQSKYLSFLSHDLRGGLNGILLMIEVLKRELIVEPRFAATLNDLDAMRRSLMETVGTMDRFLHAERFRKGKVQLKPGHIQLKPLLDEAASHFSYQARDKGVELRIEAPAECGIVSDRELLALIVQNLISNAVKYTERGAVIVCGAPSEDGCLISVEDQGPGIAPERLSSLFSPFTRGETHGKPGVGLGLSIAGQAAQVLGAKIRAESQPGKGSTFYVQVPSVPPARQ